MEQTSPSMCIFKLWVDADLCGDLFSTKSTTGHWLELCGETPETGAPLEPDVADTVASAMNDWALEHGATHYTHWFQPMTGSVQSVRDRRRSTELQCDRLLDSWQAPSVYAARTGCR